jgi:hypothetical protein
MNNSQTFWVCGPSCNHCTQNGPSSISLQTTKKLNVNSRTLHLSMYMQIIWHHLSYVQGLDVGCGLVTRLMGTYSSQLHVTITFHWSTWSTIHYGMQLVFQSVMSSPNLWYSFLCVSGPCLCFSHSNIHTTTMLSRRLNLDWIPTLLKKAASSQLNSVQYNRWPLIISQKALRPSLFQCCEHYCCAGCLATAGHIVLA